MVDVVSSDIDFRATIRSTFAEGLRNAKLHPPLTYRQFLEERVIIPDGPVRGQPFRIHRQPVIGLWVDAIDSAQWTEYVFSAPSQFGKTLAAFVGVLLWHTCELNENYVLGVPLADMASDKWEADIAPVLRASPKLRGMMPTSGAGSKDGTVKNLIQLSHGVLIKLMSAGSQDAGKAGFTSRVLGVTEAAAFTDSGGESEEADPLRQLRARQKAYPFIHRRTYIEGTLTKEEALPWSLRVTSTASGILSPCPHCGAWIEPGRDDLSGWEDAASENEAADKASFYCPACGEAINDRQRRLAVAESKLVHKGQSIDKKGRIVGDPPDTSRLWFHPSAWHNMFTSAADIAREEWRAKQIPEDNEEEKESAEKEIVQFIWSRPYKPPIITEGLVLDKRHINTRRLNLRRGVLPADTETVTIGVDLGLSAKTCWYLVLATRENGSMHVPDYDCFDIEKVDEAGNPVQDIEKSIIAALAKLQKQFAAGWTLEGSSNPRLADQVWIDCNYQTSAVLAHVHDQVKRDKSWLLGSYGRGQTMMRRVRFVKPKKKKGTIREIDPRGLWYVEWMRSHKAHAVFWDSDTSKYQVQHALTIREGEPGSITLFAGIDSIHERFAKHITNETRQFENGQPKWIRTGANHLLDVLAMARRARDRVEFLRGGGKVVTEEETEEDVSTETEPEVEPVRAQAPPVPQPSRPTKPKLNWYDRRRSGKS